MDMEVLRFKNDVERGSKLIYHIKDISQEYFRGIILHIYQVNLKGGFIVEGHYIVRICGRLIGRRRRGLKT